MSHRRVVVTGIGAVSTFGSGVQALWEGLSSGRSGIARLQHVNPELLSFTNGAEVRDFRPEDHFEKKQLFYLDRFSQFGLVAAREAIGNAAVDWTDDMRARVCVVTGSSIGGQTTTDESFHQFYAEKKTRGRPLVIPRVMPNAAASHISIEYGVTGPVYTLSTACSSSNHAIGHAFWMVRNGLADYAITGGSEAPFSYGNLKSWEALRVVAPETCRPFSKNRNGMILGEGGAMLFLETAESARARGAKIYGEVVGFGMSADATHLTHPAPRGASEAMERALLDAGVDSSAVGYVNAHGTGTPANDAMETKAIRATFGQHADTLAVSSTKSMHGHALGAAGAIEGIATILALHDGILPPTANYEEPDPDCDLNVLPNDSVASDVEYALSNSFAFGGLNAVLVFRKYVA